MINNKILNDEINDDLADLTISDLCRLCATKKEWIVELVEEGILDPVGRNHSQWRFSMISMQRARTARRLQQDLDLNLAGVALTLELLDEIELLRSRLKRLEKSID